MALDNKEFMSCGDKMSHCFPRNHTEKPEERVVNVRARRPQLIICKEAESTCLSISRLLNGLIAQMCFNQGFIFLRIGLARWRLPEKSVSALSPFANINNKKPLFIPSKSIS